MVPEVTLHLKIICGLYLTHKHYLRKRNNFAEFDTQTDEKRDNKLIGLVILTKSTQPQTFVKNSIEQ